MKRILVSVCGIGLGHATRCHPIIDELIKSGKADVKVVSYGSGLKYLRDQGIKCHEMGGFEYKGTQFTFSVLFNIIDSFRDPTKLRRDYYDFVKIADEFKPDIVFSDTEPNAFFYAHRRAIPNFVLTNLITAQNNFHLIPKKLITRDVLLQQFMVNRLVSFMQKRTERFYVPTFEQKVRYDENVMYTDVIVRKKQSELPSATELRKTLDIDKDFYYVSVGGAEIEKYLFYIIEKILPKFSDKNFVMSSNNVIKRKTQVQNTTVFPFIPNALEYLNISNGLIAPAGHSSMSEAICFKKPMLAIPVRNHIEQLANSALLEREGYGHACYLGRKGAMEDLTNCIGRFFAEREKFDSKLSASKIKGNGAKQIADDLLSY